MRTENGRGRWPSELSGAATCRSKNVNSCNKENVFAREDMPLPKAMSPQNQRPQMAVLVDKDPALARERLRELTKRRDRLLRQKLHYAGLFQQLRQQKERLQATNQRLQQQEQQYRKRLHEMEREQLVQYRRNEREKEELLDKIQMLSQMEAESGTSRIGEVEAELQKVKELFLEQQKVNTQRYNSLLKESEELQQQNRRLKDYLQSKKSTVAR